VTFSAEQTDELWSRWRRGEPSRLIARSLGCHATKVRRLLAASGGMRPPARRRQERHLSSREREEVSRGIAAGWTARMIAAGLGRSASTVSREIARNGGRGAYRAQTADLAAWQRARRPKRTRLAADPVLRGLVHTKPTPSARPSPLTSPCSRQHYGGR
jgi:hypothetical protein